MKKWAAAALAVALVGCSSEAETGTFDAEAFKQDVNGWDAVQGVVINDSESAIWVGVMDNGQRRDGYAMSVCEAVRDHSKGDLSDKTITILDGPKMAILEKRVELGKHHCKL